MKNVLGLITGLYLLASPAFAELYTIEPGQRLDFTNGVSVQCQNGGGGVHHDCFCASSGGGAQIDLGYRYGLPARLNTTR